MLQRAYSLITIKAVDEDDRTITGIATTPEPDRLGDIVEPKGAEFKLPLPLLWQHNSREPIGHVTHAKVTAAGIEIRAKFARIDEPGKLKDRLDEAWQSVKSGLVQGLSIGFNAIESARIENTFGFRFMKWAWLELSVVTIPAHQSATITALKSADAPYLAALGDGHGDVRPNSPRARGSSVAVTAASRPHMKTTPEQIKDYEATRLSKAGEMAAIMGKSAEDGMTLDAAQAEAYDTLKAEVKSLDEHLTRLRDHEEFNKKAAVEVKGATLEEAARSRAGLPVITTKANREPGIGMARAVMCKMAAHLSRNQHSALDIAKARYPDDTELHAHLNLKAAIAAGTTTDSTWAAPLVDQTTISSEFLELLRKDTIVDKFGRDGVPALRRMPFNVRVPSQTGGHTGYWVGEGLLKPVSKGAFDAVTLTYTKIAALTVITKELARFSAPAAEGVMRDSLRVAVRERMDADFIDPAIAAVAGVKPASITNGVAALSSAGASADNARTDIQNILEQYLLANMNPTSLVLIMPGTLGLALSIKVNTLGQREFPDLTMRGGSLLGIPVITSQFTANEAQYGNMVIAVNANDIALADDGEVSIDVSTEASIEMESDPENASGTVVSMFQANMMAILAERFIHWKKLRSTAVVYMDDVNWGSVGSPV